MVLAPIVLFAYNRPEHLRKTILSLNANYLAAQSEIHIFSDGPKINPRHHSPERDLILVSEVREYLRAVSGFDKVHLYFSPQNLGLANSIIQGVTKVLEDNSSVIVLEDDMISSVNFLDYMNQALGSYKDNPLVFSVSGYSFPIAIPRQYTKSTYLFNRTSSWGWGTWADRWSKVDWEVSDWTAFQKSANEQQAFNEGGSDLVKLLDLQMGGLIDSWSIRFDYACYKNRAYCVYPLVSKIANIGTDGSGTHFTESSNEYDVALDPSFVSHINFSHIVDRRVLAICKSYFSSPTFTNNNLSILVFLSKLRRHGSQLLLKLIKKGAV